MYHTRNRWQASEAASSASDPKNVVDNGIREGERTPLYTALSDPTQKNSMDKSLEKARDRRRRGGLAANC